jgi:hypothetical protein
MPPLGDFVVAPFSFSTDSNLQIVIRFHQQRERMTATAETALLRDADKVKSTCSEAPPPSETVSTVSALTMHFRRAMASYRKLTKLQVFAIVILLIINVVSGAGQLLTLNKVVAAFPSNGPIINVPFTILTLSSTLTAVITMACFIVYCIVKRPNLRFVFTLKNLVLSAGLGFTVALNGILIVSATGNVPEILQAFLLSTTVIWTFLFVKLIFGEKRSYKSPLVALSFLLSLAGILVGSASKFTASGMSLNTGLWTLVFAAGLIPGALNGVVSAKFMRDFTIEEPEKKSISKRLLEENDYLIRYGTESTAAAAGSVQVPIPTEAAPAPSKVGTDAATAKFACLAFGSLSQAVLMFCLLPASALPWFGTAPNLHVLGEGLVNGYKCTFDALPDCDGALLAFLAFLTTFIVNAVANLWLNYYSPAMTSMVGELTAPFSAVALIAIPALNVRHKAYNVGESVGAVLLITLGSVIYTVWEESTRGGEAVATLAVADEEVSSDANPVV